MADALSRKLVQTSSLMIEEQKLIEQFRDLKSEVKFQTNYISYGKLNITNDFFGKIKEKQLEDPSLRYIVELLGTKQARDFKLGTDGMLRFQCRLCILVDDDIENYIGWSSRGGWIELLTIFWITFGKNGNLY